MRRASSGFPGGPCPPQPTHSDQSGGSPEEGRSLDQRLPPVLVVPAAVGKVHMDYPTDHHSPLAAEYGFDVLTCSGFPVLRQLRELRLVTSLLPVLNTNPRIHPSTSHNRPPHAWALTIPPAVYGRFLQNPYPAQAHAPYSMRWAGPQTAIALLRHGNTWVSAFGVVALVLAGFWAVSRIVPGQECGLANSIRVADIAFSVAPPLVVATWPIRPVGSGPPCVFRSRRCPVTSWRW